MKISELHLTTLIFSKFIATLIIYLTIGKPYRHEIVHEKLPSQHKGLSYYDNDYYQVKFIE